MLKRVHSRVLVSNKARHVLLLGTIRADTEGRARAIAQMVQRGLRAKPRYATARVWVTSNSAGFELRASVRP